MKIIANMLNGKLKMVYQKEINITRKEMWNLLSVSGNPSIINRISMIEENSDAITGVLCWALSEKRGLSAKHIEDFVQKIPESMKVGELAQWLYIVSKELLNDRHTPNLTNEEIRGLLTRYPQAYLNLENRLKGEALYSIAFRQINHSDMNTKMQRQLIEAAPERFLKKIDFDKLVSNNPDLFKAISDNIKTEEMIINCLRNRALSDLKAFYDEIPDSLKTDNVIANILIQDYKAIDFIDEGFITEDTCKLVFESSIRVFNKLPERLQTKELLNFAYERNVIYNFNYIPTHLITDEFIIKTLTSDNFEVYEYDNGLISTELMAEIVKRNYKYAYHVDNEYFTEIDPYDSMPVLKFYAQYIDAYLKAKENQNLWMVSDYTMIRNAENIGVYLVNYIAANPEPTNEEVDCVDFLLESMKVSENLAINDHTLNQWIKIKQSALEPKDHKLKNLFKRMIEEGATEEYVLTLFREVNGKKTSRGVEHLSL